MTTQLKELKDEIDDLIVLIANKETDRKDESDVAEKAIILKSIERLNARLDARSATRDHLLRNPVPAPAPGKDAPSRPRRQRPSSIREHTTPPARCRVP